MVKVYVGPKRKEYHIHEESLCEQSDYFRAAFKGGFSEASDKQVYLEEDDPAAFEMVVRWIYGQRVPFLELPSYGPAHCHRALWCKVYVLADKFGLQKLKDQALGILRNQLRICRQPIVEDVEVFYNSSLLELQDLIVKKVGSIFFESQAEGSKSNYDPLWWKYVNGFHEAFAEDVITFIRAHQILPIWKDKCTIHHCTIHWVVPQEKAAHEGDS
jgi:BTB/POZ domain